MFRRPLSGASPQVPTPTRRAKFRCFRDCCSAVACKIVRHEGTPLRRRMGLCCHTVAHVPTSKASKGSRGPISYGGLRLKASALNYCVALASIRAARVYFEWDVRDMADPLARKYRTWKRRSGSGDAHLARCLRELRRRRKRLPRSCSASHLSRSGATSARPKTTTAPPPKSTPWCT